MEKWSIAIRFLRVPILMPVVIKVVVDYVKDSNCWPSNLPEYANLYVIIALKYAEKIDLSIQDQCMGYIISSLRFARRLAVLLTGSSFAKIPVAR
jgi:hypothetical protein